LCRERLAGRMFPKYGGTKVLMAALGSSLSLYFPEPCDPAKYLRFFSENILAKTQRTIVGAAKSSAARIPDRRHRGSYQSRAANALFVRCINYSVDWPVALGPGRMTFPYCHPQDDRH
jgi:hypothetical protein